jgi:hypothetical protein
MDQDPEGTDPGIGLPAGMSTKAAACRCAQHQKRRAADVCGVARARGGPKLDPGGIPPGTCCQTARYKRWTACWMIQGEHRKWAAIPTLLRLRLVAVSVMLSCL